MLNTAPMLSDSQQLYIMHFAALIGVVALALRSQLQLRAVLLASIGLNMVDHLFMRGGANVNFLLWDVVALTTNIWVLIELVLDRTHIGLTDEDERLFQAWGSLTPGEFRKLLRLGQWRTAIEAHVLTAEDAVPDSLFFVLSGDLHLLKSGRDITLDAPAFIGEVAFIQDQPASATVRLSAGGRYVVWASAALRRYFVKQQGMRVAVMRLLSADMAMKVARA